MSDDYYAMNDSEITIESVPIHIKLIDEHREDADSSISEHDTKLNDLISTSSIENDITIVRRDIEKMMGDIREIKVTLSRLENSSRCIIL
jgi:prefoldin subunit 5